MILIAHLFLLFLAAHISCAATEKNIVVIIPSYNNELFCIDNVRSVLDQDYERYRVIYINDRSTDQTLNRVRDGIDQYEQWHRVTLIDNPQRRGALANIYDAVHSCNDEDVIVFVDGDDQLKDNRVLARVNQEYQDASTWMTYGQFMYDTGSKGYCSPLPDAVIQEGSYRQHHWATTHLRTCYAWLFKRVHKRDLLYKGAFFSTSWDQAFMFPMLEMAGNHAHFIADCLYIYNSNNPINDGRVHLQSCQETERFIRAQRSYPRLASREDAASAADIVIFSYKRPLQLYALLESIYARVSNFGEIRVIYRVDVSEYAAAYHTVKKEFPEVIFAPQGDRPADDFKELVLSTVYTTPHDYVLFAVDDIIVTDQIDLKQCNDELEREQAYGFYLRLGTNICECYSLACAQPLPPLRNVRADVFAWRFADAVYDWRYAHSVDMTLYRKKDIYDALMDMHYTNPNSLESAWAWKTDSIADRQGLCFEQSRVINLPLNQVQKEQENRFMRGASVGALFELFSMNKKIDIEPFYKIPNRSVHMEYWPRFIKRNS